MKLRIHAERAPATPKRILLTRLSAIGDCILTIPTAVAAKRLWPDAELTWIVDCAAHQLLESHSAIDQIIRIPKRWLKRPVEWRVLRDELRSREFDLVLDPQGLTKSALLGWLSGAKIRVGFDYSHGRELAPIVANRRVRRTARHMVDTYLQVLSPWKTFEPGQADFAMPIYPQAAEFAERTIRELGWQNDSWISLNPGAGWTTKLWPAERFGLLAREVFREHGLRSLVFWAGESELLMAKVIEEESQGAAVAAPRTSLTEMLELLRRTSLLVTGDTGPLHMASAINAPCVSLHGPTWSDECGPYGNPHYSIQGPCPSVSRRVVRKGPNIAMQAIEVSEVYRVCRRMLASETTRAAA